MGMNRGQRRAQWQAQNRRVASTRAAATQSLSPRPAGVPSARTQGGATSVQIRELILHGFDKITGHRIASVFEQELSRLLQQHPLPASWRQAPARARTNSVRIHSMSDTRRIGEQLAAAVFGLRAAELRTGRDQ